MRVELEVSPSLDPLGVAEDEEERGRVAVDLCALREQLGVVDVGHLEARPHHVHPRVAPSAAAQLAALEAHVGGLRRGLEETSAV